MSFTPFIANVNGKRLQIMQATDDNIPGIRGASLFRSDTVE